MWATKIVIQYCSYSTDHDNHRGPCCMNNTVSRLLQHLLLTSIQIIFFIITLTGWVTGQIFRKSLRNKGIVIYVKYINCFLQQLSEQQQKQLDLCGVFRFSHHIYESAKQCQMLLMTAIRNYKKMLSSTLIYYTH